MNIIRERWIDHFQSDLAQAQTLRIISPFITHNIDHLLSSFNGGEIKVITRFNLNDFYNGVSSLSALNQLLDRGALIQGIQNLHSKLYIFDRSSAIIASANLTTNAFYNNYEFGIQADEEFIVSECLDYFEWLHSRGGDYLTHEQTAFWEEQLSRQPRSQKNEDKLPDYGTNPNNEIQERRYFIKLFGTGGNRVAREFSVRDEIERAHCHYAVCFSEGKGRPRRYRDGDVIYMARILNGTDYAFFGRGEAFKHVDDRDFASDEEIEILEWKEDWPIYIRVQNTEFIDATMGECPSMRELIENLSQESFQSTLEKYNEGKRDMNIWKTLRQQADVQLSFVGATWLENQFDSKIRELGRVDQVFINSLHQGTPY
jgi:hypothetical protein